MSAVHRVRGTVHVSRRTLVSGRTTARHSADDRQSARHRPQRHQEEPRQSTRLAVLIVHGSTEKPGLWHFSPKRCQTFRISQGSVVTSLRCCVILSDV